jgi:hypothetical protein
MSDSSPKPEHSAFARFIQTYSTFLSTFVIGVAGLVATSIWQYRQGEISRTQAEAQTEMSREKARSDWRIARAEILAKNLDVLSTTGATTADKRFGVLLSLTRGDMIDAELAVSYALELGKDSPLYMRTILGSTKEKNYHQLARAFAMTCLQRFGVARAAEICKDDALEERSQAIADLIRDEMEAQDQAGGDPRQGPMMLFTDEEDVQREAGKLAWLFEPYLQGSYEHRRWKEIERFEGFSSGARLVAALTLATSRTGEMLSEVETRQLADFHAKRRQWLASYAMGRTCDSECRARLLEFMLSTVQEAEGQYDEVIRQMMLRPRAESGRAVDQMHARLLWCQMDADDLALLREHILVPALQGAMGSVQKEQPSAVVEDLVSLFALLPAPTEPTALTAFNAARAALKPVPRLDRLFTTREANARRQRTNPPPMIRRVNFCGVAANTPGVPVDQ